MLNNYGSSSLFRCIHDRIISNRWVKNHTIRENPSLLARKEIGKKIETRVEKLEYKSRDKMWIGKNTSSTLYFKKIFTTKRP